MDNEPSYRFVRFSIKFGPLLLVAAAVAPLILIGLLTYPEVSVAALVAGVLAGVAAAFLMQLFLELIRIIADTLLPR